MQDPVTLLYIAPYAVPNPFRFTVPREQYGVTLEKRISKFITDLAAENPPPPQSQASFVDDNNKKTTLVPQPDSWVLLDLWRGTLIHSSFATPYLIKSARLMPQFESENIVLPTIATLAAPLSETADKDASRGASDPFLTMLHTILPSLDKKPKGIWEDYLEKSSRASDDHDKDEEDEEWQPVSPPVTVGGKSHLGSEVGGGHVRQEKGTYLTPLLWYAEDKEAFEETDKLFPGHTWGTPDYYHLCLWLPGSSFSWDVFVEEDTCPYAEISDLLDSVLREWTAAAGGKQPLVDELGYYPTGDSWMLVDFDRTPFIFIHSSDVGYMSFEAGKSMTYIVLPTKHSELVPAITKAMEEAEGSLGWKKYWQDKLSCHAK